MQQWCEQPGSDLSIHSVSCWEKTGWWAVKNFWKFRPTHRDRGNGTRGANVQGLKHLEGRRKSIMAVNDRKNNISKRVRCLKKSLWLTQFRSIRVLTHRDAKDVSGPFRCLYSARRGAAQMPRQQMTRKNGLIWLVRWYFDNLLTFFLFITFFRLPISKLWANNEDGKVEYCRFVRAPAKPRAGFEAMAKVVAARPKHHEPVCEKKYRNFNLIEFDMITKYKEP